MYEEIIDFDQVAYSLFKLNDNYNFFKAIEIMNYETYNDMFSLCKFNFTFNEENYTIEFNYKNKYLKSEDLMNNGVSCFQKDKDLIECMANYS